MTKTFTDNERILLDALYATVTNVDNDHVYDITESGAYGEKSGQSCTYLNFRDAPPVIETENTDHGYSVIEYSLAEDAEYRPSCIIGHGLINSDLMTPFDIFPNEGQAANMVVTEVSDIGPEVVHACTTMQTVQDSGGTWHHAFVTGLLELAMEGYNVKHYRLT